MRHPFHYSGAKNAQTLKCQTTCKLQFLLRVAALRPLAQQSCLSSSGQYIDTMHCATIKSSVTILITSHEGVGLICRIIIYIVQGSLMFFIFTKF